ncbi:uncharacterized protein LOC115758842 [Drosophila novamexicana]|uniref:uncharacterized protein LOC115758842 n=1 Tax=Drosophila novamexicana TaxID=47314 RepID=UPI0011E5B233|nr:uncharacterized protein LOC115758842 [Drosophila novamexicana]
MDIKELHWLQQVVPLAYKALHVLAKWPKKRTLSSPLPEQREQTMSPPSKRRRAMATAHAERSSNRRFWVKQENLSRDIDGLFATTFHTAHNQDEFRLRTGMTPQVFDMLFSLVGEQLNKNSIRRPIPPECRLFLTLVYLSNAERVVDLSKAFKMGSSTVRCIVQETSEVLWNTLAPAFLPQPNVEDWSNIVAGYQEAWQVPHCLGAVDAKLLDISYKSENDMILLASCDANLNFTCFDIATVTDAVNNQLHWHQDFGAPLLSQQLGDLLPAEPLPEAERKTNFIYTFIAGASFPMLEHLVTPYVTQQLDQDQLHFNKHLSRALAGSIDKAFSVLMSRWRVLSLPLRQSPGNAEKIIRAAVVLHNFVKLHDETYCPASFLEEMPICPSKHKVPKEWLCSLQQPLVKCNATIQLRESMKKIAGCKLESKIVEALVDCVE